MVKGSLSQLYFYWFSLGDSRAAADFHPVLPSVCPSICPSVCLSVRPLVLGLCGIVIYTHFSLPPARFFIYIDELANKNWFETHFSPFFHAMSAICCAITFFILFRRFRESWKNRHKRGNCLIGRMDQLLNLKAFDS